MMQNETSLTCTLKFTFTKKDNDDACMKNAIIFNSFCLKQLKIKINGSSNKHLDNSNHEFCLQKIN